MIFLRTEGSQKADQSAPVQPSTADIIKEDSCDCAKDARVSRRTLSLATPYSQYEGHSDRVIKPSIIHEPILDNVHLHTYVYQYTSQHLLGKV